MKKKTVKVKAARKPKRATWGDRAARFLRDLRKFDRLCEAEAYTDVGDLWSYVNWARGLLSEKVAKKTR